MTGLSSIPAAEFLANIGQDAPEGVLQLASHAALPVVIDAGFVNLLRVNFFLDPPDQLPFESEADLLLSPLCREIGDELYEIEPAARKQLLIMLQASFGNKRVRQVALLLEQYTQSNLSWSARAELEQAQQLTALNFIDPDRAREWLDETQAGARSERLSHEWYMAMRARLAATPSADDAQAETASAIAALADENPLERLAAVNSLATLAQLPGADPSDFVAALVQMLRTYGNVRAEPIGRDLRAAYDLLRSLPGQGEPPDLTGVWFLQPDRPDPELSETPLRKPVRSQRALRRAVDIGLTIPTREEFDCARELLDFDAPVMEHGSYFYPFTVKGSDLTGIAGVKFDVDSHGSAVTNMEAWFDLRLLAEVGLAGALDENLGLGDVVVASGIDEYRDTSDAAESEFESAGFAWRVEHDLVEFANSFRYLPGDYAAWQARSRSRLDAILRSPGGLKARARPDYLVGQIASGNVVNAANEFARWLRSHNRHRMALDLESADAFWAIRPGYSVSLLVIRGISDLADGRIPGEADRARLRRYATLNAIDLLIAMVTNANFPWPTTPIRRGGPATDVGKTATAADHVFLSYVREDSAAVDRIQEALESEGVRVWRDITDLRPGQDFRPAIRDAIADSVFIACFSTASLSRANEELKLAIDEARQRQSVLPWLIPVRLDDCEVPDLDIGGGRTLRSLNRIDLFGPGQANQMETLVNSVLAMLGPAIRDW